MSMRRFTSRRGLSGGPVYTVTIGCPSTWSTSARAQYSDGDLGRQPHGDALLLADGDDAADQRLRGVERQRHEHLVDLAVVDQRADQLERGARFGARGAAAAAVDDADDAVPDSRCGAPGAP